jgi:hypothetical protein
VFCIVDDHRRPGDGLERQPLQADCATQRENRNGATNTTKHAHEITDAPFMGQSNKLKDGRMFQTSGCAWGCHRNLSSISSETTQLS